MFDIKGLSSTLAGSAVLAAVAGFSFVAPANALNFSDGTSSFLPDVDPTLGNDTFDVDFESPVFVTGIDAVFESFFPGLPAVAEADVVYDDGAAALATFVQIAPELYELDTDIDFIFEPPFTTGPVLTLSIDAGNLFELSDFDAGSDVSFTLLFGTGPSSFDLDGEFFPVTSKSFQFSQTGPDGSFLVNAQTVPEPITMIGSLAALGFGGYLKRKKSTKA